MRLRPALWAVPARCGLRCGHCLKNAVAMWAAVKEPLPPRQLRAARAKGGGAAVRLRPALWAVPARCGLRCGHCLKNAVAMWAAVKEPLTPRQLRAARAKGGGAALIPSLAAQHRLYPTPAHVLQQPVGTRSSRPPPFLHASFPRRAKPPLPTSTHAWPAPCAQALQEGGAPHPPSLQELAALAVAAALDLIASEPRSQRLLAALPRDQVGLTAVLGGLGLRSSKSWEHTWNTGGQCLLAALPRDQVGADCCFGGAGDAFI